MESAADHVNRLTGRATTAELVAATSRRRLAAALRRGELVRFSRGLYTLPGRHDDRLIAAAYDGVLSHTSAAIAWDLPVLSPPGKPHVTVPPKRRPRPGPPAVLHWAGTTPSDRRYRLTSLVRTVTDCARILPFTEALAIADAALATGMIRRDELTTAATPLRGPGSRNARRAAVSACAYSDSFLESVLRGLLLDAGITGFEPQHLIASGPFRARVDLAHPALHIALEADGHRYHSSPTAFAADCRRYDELVATGWLVLRFTYPQLIGDPTGTVDLVKRTLQVRTDR